MNNSSTTPSPTRWFLTLVGWIVVLYGLWWGFDGAGAASAALYDIARWALPLIMPNTVESIAQGESDSWQIVTRLHPVGNPDVSVSFPLDYQIVFRAVMPVPLSLALVMSMAWRQPGKWILALVTSALLALLLTAVVIAGTASVLINHSPAIFDDDLLPKPPPFRVIAEPYQALWAHLLQFGSYFLVIVGPLITPLAVWLMLCRQQIERQFRL
jgi:hypothetical protein